MSFIVVVAAKRIKTFVSVVNIIIIVVVVIVFVVVIVVVVVSVIDALATGTGKTTMATEVRRACSAYLTITRRARMSECDLFEICTHSTLKIIKVVVFVVVVSVVSVFVFVVNVDPDLIANAITA